MLWVLPFVEEPDLFVYPRYCGTTTSATLSGRNCSSSGARWDWCQFNRLEWRDSFAQGSFSWTCTCHWTPSEPAGNRSQSSKQWWTDSLAQGSLPGTSGCHWTPLEPAGNRSQSSGQWRTYSLTLGSFPWPHQRLEALVQLPWDQLGCNH